jgi:hypothetical protein
MNDLNNGTDTSPTFKAFEKVVSKKANSQLAIRQEKFIVI